MSESRITEIYIVGPTASGKSSLAVAIALEYDGEIVCADSQTLRKHLDIGTAKLPIEDREKVPHHMLDVIEPFDEFSVAEFQAMAEKAIFQIQEKSKLPIIVGGSGMYVDSLYYNYTIEEQKTNYLKKELEAMTVAELQKIITQNNWEMPPNKQNPRHLVGVILRGGVVQSDRTSPQPQKMIVGLMPSDDELKKRIRNRIEEMFAQGLVEEVDGLLQKYGSFPERLDAIGYPLVEQYIKGEKDLDTIKEEFARGHWQYARKQKAWFKRNPNIKWFEEKNEAKKFIQTTMNKNR